jgi:DnaK suppressor protein
VIEPRDVLERRRDELRSELAEITHVPRDPVAQVSFGKRVGDGTTEAVERLTKVGTARELDAALADVERSLEKLEEGTYGLCDRCGRLIAEERLEARPWSVLCVSCAERASNPR